MLHDFISLTPSEGKKADILTITYEQNPSNIVRTANITLQTTGESGMKRDKELHTSAGRSIRHGIGAFGAPPAPAACAPSQSRDFHGFYRQ